MTATVSNGRPEDRSETERIEAVKATWARRKDRHAMTDEPKIKMPIMRELARRRADLGMPLSAVAAESGASERAISRWESGDSEPRLLDVEDYARAVGAELALRDADHDAAIEARVRAELAEEAAAKIVRCYTVLGAKPGSAVMDIAEQCIEIISEVAAGSSRDTTPEGGGEALSRRCALAGKNHLCNPKCADTAPEPLKVNLITHWLPFSVAAENHPFTDEQRATLTGHEDHQTAGAWSAFGWRELRCVSCDVTVWSVTTQEEGR